MAQALLSTLGQFVTQPHLVVLALAGTVVGIIFGALPGISSTMALAVLMPLTFGMDATSAITFLMAVFNASVYGGSISAILINIPGTPGSIVTQLDGHPMARAGKAGQAIGFAVLASGFGSLFGLVALASLAPLIARVGSQFQSPEYTALVVFGLTMLAYASPGSTLKGLLAGTLGVLLSMVGLDPLTNVLRLGFGIPELAGGVALVPLAVGVFGLAEVLSALETPAAQLSAVSRIGSVLPGWRELVRLWPTALRGSIIGTLIGAIPAAGSAIAVVLAYTQEKRLSRHPERFGTGIPEGIVAAESANNACIGGAMIPMMTFGIPGDTMTAVLIGALLVHGLRPGPELFREHADFVMAVLVSLAVATVLTTALGLLGARAAARIFALPRHLMLPAIAVLCVVGSYAVNNSFFDVQLMVVFGVLGYLMNKAGVPAGPVVFGLTLGPLFEENLRRTLVVYDGNWWVFLTRPVSVAILGLSALTLLAPALARVVSHRSPVARKTTPGLL